MEPSVSSSTGNKDIHLVRMDKAKAQAATKDISNLLHQAFEKHKTVTKGYAKVEEELRKMKEESEQDKKELFALRRRNHDLNEELKEVKKRIADLSSSNERLRKEADRWSHEATVNIGLAREAKGALAELTAGNLRNLTDNISHQPLRTIQPLASPAQKQSMPTPATVTPSRSSNKEPPTVIIDIVDSDGEEKSSPSPSLPRKNLFNGHSTPTAAAEVARVAMLGSLIPESPDFPVEDNSFSSEGSTKKRKSEEDWEDRAESRKQENKQKERPLQTNTCKVCERYWRAEDARKPGQLKTFDVPWCRIHGRTKRPPSTPENFWKQRLSPPKDY
ncbi:hypothetical protein RvY_12205 [Ramazzottius varieornatus]|uniref:DNA endonuclease activator Ctp1 C-terminal domain-containing protein n=1 Tax=Ramazzottius varieornatus TaxID=947166 RepID=A0A1D1VKQ0_RAMVA|nr:hypothetical protein RvY_12205 [Ramazzottius varieornatus]